MFCEKEINNQKLRDFKQWTIVLIFLLIHLKYGHNCNLPHSFITGENMQINNYYSRDGIPEL